MIRSLILVCFLLLSTYAMGGIKTNFPHDGYLIKFNSQKSFGSEFKNMNYRLIKGFNMAIVKELPKNFQKSNNIQYIEPNYIYHAFVRPNDDKYSQQWGLQKIQAERAWDIQTGSKDIVIAVIDTGVAYSHSDLKNQMWINEKELNGKAGVDDDGNGFIDDIYGYDFANNDGDPMDDNNHGSHCSGVIGAEENNGGTVGVNWNVRIMAVKFLTGEGSGTLESAIQSIKYAVDNGAKILSNSWGGGGYSQALEDVIKYAKSKGVLFVAAAGNEYNNNDSTPTYPASYNLENVLSVAATDSADVKASFSNYGKTVHVAAPGVDILSSIPGGYASYSGTSMACPHVAGAAALLLAQESDLSYLEVKNRIIKTSDYVEGLFEQTFNGGRLNLYNMLQNIEPVRPLPPDEDKWSPVDYSIETPHPYLDAKTYSYEITIPQGSKFFRIHFTRFETEASYDKVTIKAGNKSVVYDGNRGAFYTSALNVDKIIKVQITFVTDGSVNGWGFAVDKYDIQ